MSNPYDSLLRTMGADEAAALLAAAAARLAGAAPTVVDAETAIAIEDCAEMDLSVPQWARVRDDGTVEARGVRIRALTFRDRMTAEKAATLTKKDGSTEIDPWRLQAEEVVRGVVRPKFRTVDQVLGMNYEAIQHIHAAICRLGPQPAALVARELARVAGGDPPPRPRDGRDAVASDVGGGGGAAQGDPAADAGGAA